MLHVTLETPVDMADKFQEIDDILKMLVASEVAD